MLQPQPTSIHQCTWQVFGFASVARRSAEFDSAQRSGDIALPSILSISSERAIPKAYRSWRRLTLNDARSRLSFVELMCLSAALRYARLSSVWLLDVLSHPDIPVSDVPSVHFLLSDRRTVAVSDDPVSADLGYIVQSGHPRQWFDITGVESVDSTQSLPRSEWAWAATLVEALALDNSLRKHGFSSRPRLLECH